MRQHQWNTALRGSNEACAPCVYYAKINRLIATADSNSVGRRASAVRLAYVTRHVTARARTCVLSGVNHQRYRRHTSCRRSASRGGRPQGRSRGGQRGHVPHSLGLVEKKYVRFPLCIHLASHSFHSSQL